MIYRRKIYENLLIHAQSEYVTVLTGMRRTGKTTIVKQLLEDLENKNSIYLDVQRPDIQDIFYEKNYDAVRESLVNLGLSIDQQMIVVLDEIQFAPELPSIIKYLYDHFRIKFIVTGSSSDYLKNLFSESLAGRKRIFELFPLDFAEFLTFKQIAHSSDDWQNRDFDQLGYARLSSYYEEFVKFGGFPQVVLANSEEEKKNFLSEIMSSYINIDVRSLADFSDGRNLYNLTKLLAARVGNKIEYSKLSNITGLSRPTITNYITFLEKTYLIRTIEVFTKSIEKKVSKSRKIYFADTGLANSLADISSGAQFENTLYNQLAMQGSVHFFSVKSGHEIDFVLNGEVAIEAKETPIEGDLNQLAKLSEKAKIANMKLVGRHQSPKFSNYIWGGSIL